MEQVKFLNEVVASFGVLYIKLHQYHWNLKGKHFFTLHEKLEEIYDGVTENLDDVAERIRQLDAYPVSTLKEFLELSIIKEKEYKEMSGSEMIEDLLNDYETLNNKYLAGIEEFGSDPVTADMLTQFAISTQKTVWMLKAYLNK